MRGTRANLIIRQGADQHYVPTLYIEPRERNSGDASPGLDASLKAVLPTIQRDFPGIEITKITNGWEVVVPEKYNEGHEAHFGRVSCRIISTT